MRNSILLPILVLFSAHAFAAPLKFVEHNCSVEIPPGWSAINPQPPDSLLAVQSPDKVSKFVLFATKTSTREHPNAAGEVRDRRKQEMTKAGYKIDPEQAATIGDLAFVTFTAHLPSGGSVTEYTTTAGDQVYLIQAISKDQDAPNDPQLQQAVQSFRLLGAPATVAAEPPPPVPKFANNYARLIFAGLFIMAAFMFFKRLMLSARK
jgi:hypothetical protein